VKVSEFEAILMGATMNDLYAVRQQMGSKFGFMNVPVWDTGNTKAEQVRHFTYWVKENPGKLQELLAIVKEVSDKRAMTPVRGPVPNTHYIKWSDISKLPGFQFLWSALNYELRGKSQTRDGYLSVAAIYNMSAWANWKSSSLSNEERANANAIDNQLNLGALMKLNEGRRRDQPALFPQNLLA